ncbi:MAG TPA: hypothetical protein VIK18_23735 [Pirellulales bacterium]
MVVDLAADGRAIGIEIPIPAIATLEAINAVLQSYGFPPLDPRELEPLRKAA